MSARRRKWLLRFGVAVAALALLVYVSYRLFEDPTNQMFGPTVVSGPTDQRVVALTYDDGPNPPYTNRILDVLKKEHIHATFFVVGRAAAQYPATVRRMAAEGQAIGNHTWDHVHLLVLPRSAMRSEMLKTDAVVYRLVHQHPKIMRPPFGARDWRVVYEMKRLGYAVIMCQYPCPRTGNIPAPASLPTGSCLK